MLVISAEEAKERGLDGPAPKSWKGGAALRSPKLGELNVGPWGADTEGFSPGLRLAGLGSHTRP